LGERERHIPQQNEDKPTKKKAGDIRNSLIYARRWLRKDPVWPSTTISLEKLWIQELRKKPG
jgi:hypothetical protein